MNVETIARIDTSLKSRHFQTHACRDRGIRLEMPDPTSAGAEPRRMSDEHFKVHPAAQ